MDAILMAVAYKPSPSPAKPPKPARSAQPAASMRTAKHDERSNGAVAPDPLGCRLDDDANIVVVQLTKPTSSAPVGVDLVSGGDASSPPVLKAVKGLALACGQLQPGDLLLSVNEVEVTDPDAAVALIRAAPDHLVLRFRRPPVSG